MKYPKEQVDELRKLGSELATFDFENVTYFLISDLWLPDGCSPSRSDALLCTSNRGDGYPSRLFFPQKIKTKTQRNWAPENGARISDRVWFAISWKAEQPDLRLAQMVGIHLGAMR